MRTLFDEQMVRAFGVSLRTVRRRIADHMDDQGVTSRFQLGVEVVRRGWLSAHPGLRRSPGGSTIRRAAGRTHHEADEYGPDSSPSALLQNSSP